MQTSLNYTSFSNPKVALEIRAAMVHVLKTGEVVRLLNRHKQPWLLVTIIKDTLGYRFAFLDTENGEQGHNIRKACIRVWSDLDSLSFWSLNAESYDLTEHPLVTVAREEAVKAAKAMEEALLRAEGVTHVAHSWGGSKIHVAYQRNWLGKRVLYALQSGTNNWQKVSKEALACIRHVEAF